MQMPFNRTIDDSFIATFIELLHQHFALEVTAGEIRMAAAAFDNIEQRMSGRVAGDIEDYLLNYFIRKLAFSKFASPEHVQVEIGVLFGGSLIYTYNALEGRAHFIGIDPLDGYYVKDATHGSTMDRISGQAVSSETLNRNIEELVVDRKNLEVIQGYSSDPHVLEQIADRKITVLFVDGDHSYEGLRRDLDNYLGNVVDGGFVIIDNYNDEAWPEVKKYCDDFLAAGGGGFGNPLVFGRSLVLIKGQKLSAVDLLRAKSESRMVNGLIERRGKVEERVKLLEDKTEALRKYQTRLGQLGKIFSGSLRIRLKFALRLLLGKVK